MPSNALDLRHLGGVGLGLCLLPRHQRGRWQPGHARTRRCGRVPRLRVHTRLQQQPAELPRDHPPLAAAGFVVPSSHFTNLGINDVYDGDQFKDISAVITQSLAPNSGSDPLTGHVDTAAGVGVSGHSTGGMTTHGLARFPDQSGGPMSCVDIGSPGPQMPAKVLFMHGDKDSATQCSSARQAYAEMPPTSTRRPPRPGRDSSGGPPAAHVSHSGPTSAARTSASRAGASDQEAVYTNASYSKLIMFIPDHPTSTGFTHSCTSPPTTTS